MTQLAKLRLLQIWAYSDCLNLHRNEHQWIMGLDVDEFVVLRKDAGTNDIGTFLTDYESYGGLAVEWRVFGSAGFDKEPVGGMIRNFDKCQADPYIHRDGFGIKTIANTGYARQWESAHEVNYFDDTHWTVDADTKSM